MRLLFAALTAAALLPVLASATDFGAIELVEGQVTVQTQEGQVLLPKVGDTVATGAELVTGRDGELHIATEDGGYLALRPNTRVRIAEFRAEGDDLDTQILSLLRGSFRAVTGWIGKHNPERYKITTPTATIGVRGTDHEPTYIPDGDEAVGPGSPPGTYEKVNEGVAYLESEGGRVEVAPSQAGYAPRGRIKPTRLAQIPKFFRASANEHRILVRREQLRKAFEQHRAERREDQRARLERMKVRQDERRDPRRKRN